MKLLIPLYQWHLPAT